MPILYSIDLALHTEVVSKTRETVVRALVCLDIYRQAPFFVFPHLLPYVDIHVCRAKYDLVVSVDNLRCSDNVLFSFDNGNRSFIRGTRDPFFRSRVIEQMHYNSSIIRFCGL